MVWPQTSIKITDCVNHRQCTKNIMGNNKYVQYSWVCHTCNTIACLACAKGCHAECKGLFVAVSTRCKCLDVKKYCKCYPSYQAYDLDGVSRFSFNVGRDLLSPPYDDVAWGNALRYKRNGAR
jgi:hypothetical protein